VGERVLEPLLAHTQRLVPPLAQEPVLALALLALDLVAEKRLVAERVLHKDEREPVVPVAALAPAERRLREEVPQDGHLRVVVALRARRDVRQERATERAGKRERRTHQLGVAGCGFVRRPA